MASKNLAKKLRLLSTTAFVAGIMLSPQMAHADPTNSWDYDSAIGDVTKDVSVAGITNINVGSGNAFAEGNGDIYAGHTVNVNGSGNSTFAYQDNRDNIQSTLDGTLNSNIRVVIIDKDGVFFTGNSRVDVQGLVTTSADVSVADIMDGGDLTFNNVGDGGEIVNEGEITIRNAGLAAFVSPFVENAGVIRARLGNVVMAAGETVTLDMYGDGLVEVAVEGELEDAYLNNTGEIIARGGNVQMTALAAKKAIDNVINNDGLITVSSATVEGGKIILSGGEHGTIRNRGILRTSTGGEINITGERFLQVEKRIYDLKKPKFQLKHDQDRDFAEFDIAFADSRSSNPVGIRSNGGDVNITTSGNVLILDGRINARNNNTGLGGSINIDNGGVFYSANANTLRTNGEGTITLNQNKRTHPDLHDIPFGHLLFLKLTGQYDKAAALWAEVYGPEGTIQNAIDAIDNSGTGLNTVNIGAGEYHEDVLANHDNLVLNGAFAGTPATGIRGAETIIWATNIGVNVSSNNVTLNGLAIGGGNTGVYAYDVSNLTLLNNLIALQTGNGIEIDESDFITIQGNQTSHVGDTGIFINQSQNILIGGYGHGQGNWVNNSFTGIKILSGRDLQIIGNDINTITGTPNLADGIHITGTRNILVDSNIIYNIVDEGVFIGNGKGNVVVQNNQIGFVGGNGIELLAPEQHSINTISGNRIVVVGLDGILVKNSNPNATGYVDVLYNNLDNIGLSGISIDRNARNVSHNSIWTAGENGIEILNSDDITIQKNMLTDIGDKAIYVVNAANALIGGYAHHLGNYINNAFTGIMVINSSDVDVVKNDINNITGGEHFGDGIHLNNVENAFIAWNKIKDISDEGIFIRDGEGSLVVKGNKIENVDGNGIELISTDVGAYATIFGNELLNIGLDGILIKESGDYAGASIFGNFIYNTGLSGIKVDRNADYVKFNTVLNAGEHGISIKNSDGVHVFGNYVKNTALNGIEVQDSDYITIQKNILKNIGDQAIYVRNAFDALIGGYYGLGNIINNAITGIMVVNSSDVEILKNDIDTITGSGHVGDGIRLFNVENAFIAWNKIRNVADEGIFIRDGEGSLIVKENNIKNAGGNGIELISTDAGAYATIIGNFIENVDLDGILIKESGDYAGASIFGNWIKNTGLSGIKVDRNADYVKFNTVLNAGEHGITINNSDGVKVFGNFVKNTILNGIDVQNSDYITIQANTLKDIGDKAIYVANAANALIGSFFYGLGNVINNAATGIMVLNSSDVSVLRNDIDTITAGPNFGDGVHLNNVENAFIAWNNIKNVSDEGIFIRDGEGSLVVKGNFIKNAQGNGIELISTDAGAYATIFGNFLYNIGLDGILIKESGNYAGSSIIGNFIKNVGLSGIKVDRDAEYVKYNTVMNAGEYGITVANAADVHILNNNVSNTNSHGLYVAGANNGSIVVQGNNFTDTGLVNGVASARFESGEIDMSDLTNPNTFTNTSGLAATALQFDGENISLVGNTLGSTVFTGYLPEGSFYVRIEPGTLLSAPFTPILIDATFVNFDGVVPGLIGPVLPSATYNFIENRLFDADDPVVNAQGQIFIGFEFIPPTTVFGFSNFQDFLEQTESNGDAPNSSASLTINGQPPVTQPTLLTTASLANLEPAAGEEEGGNTAEELADISPEAGPDSKVVSCIDDVVTSLSQGSVTYNFGGTFEDSIAAASVCGVTTEI
nr:hypothetical protein [Cytophagales bacterium]